MKVCFLIYFSVSYAIITKNVFILYDVQYTNIVEAKIGGHLLIDEAKRVWQARWSGQDIMQT
jgi:hypothetical protein